MGEKYRVKKKTEQKTIYDVRESEPKKKKKKKLHEKILNTKKKSKS